MRWNEALHAAAHPKESTLPVTIAHRSGSYQDIYPDRFFIYPVGIATAIRTARTSVVDHILNEFELNDNGWYAPAIFHKQRSPRFAWLSWFFSCFRSKRTPQGAQKKKVQA